MDKKERQVYVVVIVGLLLVAGYAYITGQNTKRDLYGQINTMESNLATLIGGITERVDDVKRNLSLENMLLDSKLESLKSNTDKRISTLTDVVDDLQTESSQALDSLKRDLESINVQSSDFTGVVEDVLPGVVSVQTNVGLGSGAIVRKNGYIVTNNHVIAGATIIRAVKFNKDGFSARVVGVDANADVAVLKISGSHRELWFADARSIRVGEKVIALGNPGGLDFTVTEGIVSATNRLLPNGINYIQTDVPINPGNSGGPLVDKNGRIIGLNNFKIAGFEGIGFAIESNVVEDISDRIIATDEARS